MKKIALSLVLILAPSLTAQVLAQVDDAVLTWEDLLEQAGGIEALNYMGITSESEASQILESWVRERLVVAAAESAGLRGRPEVEKAVQAAIDQVLIEAYITDVLDEVEVSRLEVENYLDIWRDSYGKEYNARHILLDSQVLAGSVLSRLSGGESFESLAVNFSSCPSSREGGNLGWLRRGMTSATFMEAVCLSNPARSPGSLRRPLVFISSSCLRCGTLQHPLPRRSSCSLPEKSSWRPGRKRPSWTSLPTSGVGTA
ncbi:MAG: peptidylprolyl isomerase [Desulfobacterales bacterium]|nr:peptidylprolyl isomerase [Desulfobacterales bacterium]